MRLRSPALVISTWIVLACVQPARADSLYYCDTLSGSACTHFTAASDGLATFETLGLTGQAIGYAVAFGIGLVLLFFVVGLAFGHAVGAVETTLGGDPPGE